MSDAKQCPRCKSTNVTQGSTLYEFVPKPGEPDKRLFRITHSYQCKACQHAWRETIQAD